MKRRFPYRVNKELHENALLLGLTPTTSEGFYHYRGKLIDLTASGNEKWQIMSNVAYQLVDILNK